MDLELRQPSIAQSIVTNLASKVWTNVKERFAYADCFRISDLKRDLHNLKQNHLSIGDYFPEVFTILKFISDNVANWQVTSKTCNTINMKFS